MGIHEFADRLENVRPTSNGYQACCPAHDDDKASLCIHQEPDGKILIKCQAGCDTKDVLRAMGIDWSALFPDGVPEREPSPKHTSDKPGKKPKRKSPHLTAAIKETYSYTDENGNELYRVVRWEPKDFTVQHLEKTDKVAGYVDGLGGRKRVLYRLPKVRQAIAEGKTVFIVEGEKDVHTIERLGHVGTCNPGGAGKWLDSYSKSLAGADVVIVPDVDLAGRKHADLVGLALEEVAARTRFIRLPVTRAKGDVSDWVSDGGTAEAFAQLVESAQDWQPGMLVSESEGAPVGPDGEPLNDLGNARRLVKAHGEQIRYCTSGNWYAWDGRRWVKDETGEVHRFAKGIVDTMLAQAPRMRREADASGDDESIEAAKAFERHALRSGDHARIKAMIAECASEPGVPVVYSAMDSTDWMFSCENGTIDLRTGELRPHDRSDLITKISDVPYDPHASCPTWERFLSDVFKGDEELIRFLQLAVGYTMTGDTREQMFFVLHGCGSNGKSTFITALREIFGDYHQKTSTDTLIEKKNSGPSNDVAALRGARYVSAIETSAGKRLAEALVKELTGQDAVTARFLYQEFFTFTPKFKLWLACNHVPVIQGQDDGIWRRIRLIPFKVQFYERHESPVGPFKDKGLPEQLRSEYPGILAWAVRGAVDWCRSGLTTPDAVVGATTKLRQDMDILGGFLSECCLLDRNASVRAKDLYDAYSAWAEENGERPVSSKYFGMRLGERGSCESYRTNTTRYWRGIGLLSDRVPARPVTHVTGVTHAPRESITRGNSTHDDAHSAHIENVGQVASHPSHASQMNGPIGGGSIPPDFMDFLGSPEDPGYHDAEEF